MKEEEKNKKYPLIKMENIHKQFNGVLALKGIIEYNEIVGLVGDNGTEKINTYKNSFRSSSSNQGNSYWFIISWST